MPRMKATEVNAVLSEEFDQLLGVLEIREQFESGAFSCAHCQEPITRENVMMIFPLPERRVGFACAKHGCGVEYAVAS